MSGRSGKLLRDVTVTKAAALSSATLHEAAGRTGALPSCLKPLSPSQSVCGRALPVAGPPGDNLWLHHAIYAANPGDVLVADVGHALEFGYWGEVMAVAAQARRIAGLVIAGGVRDSQRMIDMAFPVFAANICIRGTAKDPQGRGQIGAPVRIGEVSVARGDLVFGDADGVVVLPADRATEIVDAAYRRDQTEQLLLDELRAGRTTLKIYQLPTPVFRA